MSQESAERRISESMRLKANETLQQILSGDFREADVEGLLIKLREHSGNQTIFKEIAHFVAHPARNQGIIARALEWVYFSLKHHFEYTLEGKKVKFDEPFPSYLLNLLRLQVDAIDEDELKQATGLTKQRAKPRIESTFKEDKATKKAALQSRAKLNKDNEQLFEFLLTSLIAKPLFTQNDIISEMIAVMRYNKLTFDPRAFWGISYKIMLCILALIHHTEFDVGGHVPIRCSIDSDVRFNFVNPQTQKQWYGNLRVVGLQIVQGPPMWELAFPLIETSLDAQTYCESSMFVEPYVADSIESLATFDFSRGIPTVISSDRPLPLGDVKDINFFPPIKVTKDFKLMHTSGAAPYPYLLKQ